MPETQEVLQDRKDGCPAGPIVIGLTRGAAKSSCGPIIDLQPGNPGVTSRSFTE